MYLSPAEAGAKFKVTDQTLRTWATEGKIKYITTEGGHRRYLIDNPISDRKKVVYARVSSKKQEKDLERQIEFLKQKYPNFEVISDIGSGINYKRKGFRKILECLFKGNLEECVVTSNDRFSRYGDLFEWMFTKFNSKFTSLSDEREHTDEQELAEDLMEIVTVFSARYYGRRKYKSVKESENLPECKTEEDV